MVLEVYPLSLSKPVCLCSRAEIEHSGSNCTPSENVSSNNYKIDKPLLLHHTNTFSDIVQF